MKLLGSDANTIIQHPLTGVRDTYNLPPRSVVEVTLYRDGAGSGKHIALISKVTSIVDDWRPDEDVHHGSYRRDLRLAVAKATPEYSLGGASDSISLTAKDVGKDFVSYNSRTYTLPDVTTIPNEIINTDSDTDSLSGDAITMTFRVGDPQGVIHLVPANTADVNRIDGIDSATAQTFKGHVTITWMSTRGWCVTGMGESMFAGYMNGGSGTNMTRRIYTEWNDHGVGTSSGNAIKITRSGYYTVFVSQLSKTSSAVYLQIRINGSSKKHAYKNGTNLFHDMVVSWTGYIAAGQTIDAYYSGGTVTSSYGTQHSTVSIKRHAL